MIILASNSPRRKELLAQIGVNCKAVPSKVDEKRIYSLNRIPQEFCRNAAIDKSLSIAKKNSNDTVIGADTIVVNDGVVYGKPENSIDSKYMLKSLSGKSHNVYTGVSINNISLKFSCTYIEQTTVIFRNINEHEIDYYIKNYNVFDKAGSYGIQCYASRFVTSIIGCFYNVMGLPLSRLSEELIKLKEID